MGEIGRTLPKKPELPFVNDSSEEGVGEFGYAWSTVQACWSAVPSVLSETGDPFALKQFGEAIVAVNNFQPSKLSQSSTTFQ